MKDVAEGKRLMILQLLHQHGPKTGKELVSLDDSLNEDTIYVTLARMENERHWLRSDKDTKAVTPGHPKRRYRIVGAGVEAMKKGALLEAIRNGEVTI